MNTGKILISGGRVIDPGKMDVQADLWVENGRIAAVIPLADAGKSSTADDDRSGFDIVIDAAGLIVVPGLIDMHVHLREPGQEYKETIASGCAAAARGGFTAVCAMPNTLPVNDCPQVTEFILRQAQKAHRARVYPVAAISLGSKGRQLSPFEDLKAAGVRALSDDGQPVTDDRLMQLALEKADKLDLLVISHCEDLAIAGRGVMNHGPTALRLGLAGIPNAAETRMVERDIHLSALTGAPVHIAHVSARESVQTIRTAKKNGLPVTAETAPHYFTLTDESVITQGTNAKMNPPLRSQADRQAVREGLADGTLDVIATDHAPHAPKEKELPFEKAPNGIIGLETALSLSLGLVQEGVLSLTEMLAKMTINPARLLKLKSGLAVGQAADVTLVDMQATYTVNAQKLLSLSRNTPFEGRRLTGKAVMTLVGGEVIDDTRG